MREGVLSLESLGLEMLLRETLGLLGLGTGAGSLFLICALSAVFIGLGSRTMWL